VPLVGVYDTAAKLPVVLLARDSIKTVQDLRGKKINLSSAPGGFVDRMNRAALATAGLKPEDVTMVPSTTSGRVPPLLTGAGGRCDLPLRAGQQSAAQRAGVPRVARPVSGPAAV
jgi:ABC-type nitrate/sulfonate/bicarbonate transport system substrate-binding protein